MEIKLLKTYFQALEKKRLGGNVKTIKSMFGNLRLVQGIKKNKDAHIVQVKRFLKKILLPLVFQYYQINGILLKMEI